MKSSIMVIAVSALLLIATTATARNWRVPDDAPTIQAGIDSAGVGDTVLVACGTYYEHDITMKSGISLRSNTGLAECVTVNAQGAGRGFLCADLDNTTNIEGFTIIAGWLNGNGGGIYCTNSFLTIHGCILSDNWADYGGGMYSTGGSPTLNGCILSDNWAVEGGGGMYSAGGFPIFNDCMFIDNVADNGSVYGDGGGLVCGDATLTDCAFVGNRAMNVGGALLPGSPLLRNCTIRGNSASGQGGPWDGQGGGGIFSGSPTLENVIFAFNHNKAINNSSPILTCCDVFGNGGGPGDAEPWIGINGNIAEDPLFCGPDDLYLSSISPCLYGLCDQIGAFGQGCGSSMPRIMSILDVGNDQGRRVRINWQRSIYDASGDTVEITGYAIYRRQDQYKRGFETSAQLPGIIPEGHGARLDGWDYIDTVPARGDSLYQFVAPTLCDSTIQNGICWSVFFISATTTNPLIYFDSPPDSGCSIDNLAPGIPGNFRFESPILLVWDEATEEDFNYFSVYGSSTPDFDEAELIDYTIGTSMDVSAHHYEFYHVATTDFAGNQGQASTIGPTSRLPGQEEMPKSFALGQIHPNPGGSRMLISFDLPRAETVELVIINITGRHVLTLVEGMKPAGRHTIIWKGNDSSGRRVSIGIYFVSFVAGDFIATRKLVTLK